MFPQDMCDVLSSLHTNAPTHSYEVSRLEVEQSFKCSLETLFTSFEKEPLASGSIAQVHKAVLASGAHAGKSFA